MLNSQQIFWKSRHMIDLLLLLIKIQMYEGLEKI